MAVRQAVILQICYLPCCILNSGAGVDNLSGRRVYWGMIKLIALLLPLLFACDLRFQQPSVSVTLPEFPAIWSGALAWELSWINDRGGTGLLCLPAGRTVYLPLGRDSEALVELRALFPLIGSAAFFRTQPLGAVYPLQLRSEGGLVPDIGGGWCAALARPLFVNGWRLAQFNWRRLSLELAARFEDPWLLDPQQLVPKLAEGQFRADYLKHTGDAIFVFVPETGGFAGLFQGDSRLVPASPLGPALVWGDFLAGCFLRPGRYRWFIEGVELSLDLSLGGDRLWSLSAAMP